MVRRWRRWRVSRDPSHAGAAGAAGAAWSDAGAAGAMARGVLIAQSMPTSGDVGKTCLGGLLF